MFLGRAPITLDPLGLDDVEPLLRFELAHRAHFERSIPGRGDAYYQPASVERAIATSLEARGRGTDFMYLIRDAAGEIVGRVNLVDVQRGPVQSAEIGYRVGEGHEGRGYATQAFGLIVAEAFETLGLHRVEAATAPANVGSQLVLVRNGFAPYGRAHGAILVHGVWHDSLLFEPTNPSWS